MDFRPSSLTKFIGMNMKEVPFWMYQFSLLIVVYSVRLVLLIGVLEGLLESSCASVAVQLHFLCCVATEL